eukprot:TRINITY_DN15137_c0_g1_i4.p1 TRINITY_DN15137_c0_g1~~TRINITY_DN15137_c0_g1_i4.p1  ORF type:complete len:565 (-),score=144.03 TRINITY_DN15137_c0_g1_i4:117-1811(-)
MEALRAQNSDLENQVLELQSQLETAAHAGAMLLQENRDLRWSPQKYQVAKEQLLELEDEATLLEERNNESGHHLHTLRKKLAESCQRADDAETGLASLEREVDAMEAQHRKQIEGLTARIAGLQEERDEHADMANSTEEQVKERTEMLRQTLGANERLQKRLDMAQEHASRTSEAQAAHQQDESELKALRQVVTQLEEENQILSEALKHSQQLVCELEERAVEADILESPSLLGEVESVTGMAWDYVDTPMTPHETSALPGGPRARVARVSSLDPKPDPHMPLNPRGLGGARDEIDQDGSSFQMFCDALDECAAPAAETASKGDLFRDTQAQAIHHTGYNQWLNDRLSLPRAADGLAFEEYALLLDKMLVVAAADSELQQAAERALHILHSAPTSPSGDLSHETLVKPLLVGCRRFELPEAAALAVKGISGLGQLQSLRQITGCHPELLERLCAGCCDLIGHYITQPKLHPECTNQAVGAAMELVAVGIRGKALLRTMDCARQAHAAASRKHQIELLRSVCFRLLLIAMPVPARDSGPQRDAIDPDVAEPVSYTHLTLPTKRIV